MIPDELKKVYRYVRLQLDESNLQLEIYRGNYKKLRNSYNLGMVNYYAGRAIELEGVLKTIEKVILGDI
jgi:hypothetical protein